MVVPTSALPTVWAWGVHLDPLTLPLRIDDYNVSIPDFKITTRGQRLTMDIAVAANGDLDLLLESDAPVRFEEIAKAANIADFPFEGAFDVGFVGILRQLESPDFRVELDFSDITYLDMGRGVKHLLGDAYLLGKLVEQKTDKRQGLQVQNVLKSVKLGDTLPTTHNPQPTTYNQYDICDFQGHGFDGTGRIRGTVSTAEGNPVPFCRRRGRD